MIFLLPIIGFFFGLNYGKSNSWLSALYPVPVTLTLNQQNAQTQVSCLNKINTLNSEQNSKLIRAYGQIFLVDKANGYTLNISNLPEITSYISEENFPNGFDMYAKKNGSSIARFEISKVYSNQNKLSLMDFAKKQFGYIQKTASLADSSVVVSAFSTVNFSDPTITAISWTNTEHGSKTYLSKHYVIEKNGKIIQIYMFTWNEQDYIKALADFKPIVASLKL